MLRFPLGAPEALAEFEQSTRTWSGRSQSCFQQSRCNPPDLPRSAVEHLENRLGRSEMWKFGLFSNMSNGTNMSRVYYRFFWMRFRQSAFLTMPKPWVLVLSFEFMLLRFFFGSLKKSIHPSKMNYLFWQYFIADLGFSVDYCYCLMCISSLCLFRVNFCYFLEFCQNLKFLFWVISVSIDFFVLEGFLFPKVQKKPGLLKSGRKKLKCHAPDA